MKLTKKAAALLLAASLAVSVCATPVFAADPAKPSTTVSENDAKKEANTNVIYMVDSKYTWSIPAKIDFGSNAGVGKTRTVKANTAADVASKEATNTTDGTAPKVYVTENIIAPGSALKISIDTANSSYLNGSFLVGVNEAKATEYLYFKIHKLANDGSSGDELNASKSEVLSVSSGTKTGEQALVFALKTTTTDTAEKAGKYTGTIVFKSEVK